MSSRRLTISSLLCDDGPSLPTSNSPPKASMIVPEPVVLAPHLRNQVHQRAERQISVDHKESQYVYPGRRPPSPPHQSATDLINSAAESHGHWNEQPYHPRQRSPSQPHAPHSPGFSHPYTNQAPIQSPVLSYAQHTQSHQSPNSSPSTDNYHQSFQRPSPSSSSSFSPKPTHSRRTSQSHSRLTLNGSPPLAPPSHRTDKFGLDALVHVASQERRRMSSGSEDGDRRQVMSSEEYHYPDRHSLLPQVRPHGGAYPHTYNPASRSPDTRLRTLALSPQPQQGPSSPYMAPAHRFPDRGTAVDKANVSPIEELTRKASGPSFSTHPHPLNREEHGENFDRRNHQYHGPFYSEREPSRYSPSSSTPSHSSSLSLLLQPSPEPSVRRSSLNPYPLPPSARSPDRRSDPGQTSHDLFGLTLDGSRRYHQPAQTAPHSPRSHISSFSDDRSGKRRRYSDTEPAMIMDVDMVHQFPHVRPNIPREQAPPPEPIFRAPSSPRPDPIPRQSVHVPPGHPRRPGSGSLLDSKRARSPERDKKEFPPEPRKVEPINQNRLVSPLGRRSPPGSQAGRAIAARKAELDHSEIDTPSVKIESKDHQLPSPSTAPAPIVNVAADRVESSVKTKTKVETDSASLTEPPRPDVSVKMSSHESDAHEWLLEHYADTSPSRPQLISKLDGRSAQGSPSPQEAATALEEELIPSPLTTMDIDIDVVVEKLVADLEPGLSSRADVMDVEDELLSLLADDKPTLPHRTSSSHGASADPQRLTTLDTHLTPDSPMLSPSPAPSGPVTAARATSVRPMSDRESMPPPASVETSKTDKAKKKSTSKVRAAKATTPTSVPTKPKAKTAPKSKARATESIRPALTPTPGAAPNGTGKAGSSSSLRKAATAIAASRSRSTSVMPRGPDAGEEDSEQGQEEDKLYCVCKTTYDEDKLMIACDKCDEWYHTPCVKIPDRDVDLVDQFFCPPCVAKNPSLVLQTTYKRRCLQGVEHPEPDSSKACRKPSRGALSKYCSEDCGKKNLRRRIEEYERRGGSRDVLWENVKDADKREGVAHVIHVLDNGKPQLAPVKPTKSKNERHLEHLTGMLDDMVQLRNELKTGMDMVVWRERLLSLAVARAEPSGLCGWDQRLCYGEAEWVDFGEECLASYEAEGMDVDGEGQWWCTGDSECGRHAGWQSLRRKDVVRERERKDEALMRLTKKEREIRKRIEDMVEPQGGRMTKAPLRPLSAKVTNGHSKNKPNGTEAKKGKKRKVPPT